MQVLVSDPLISPRRPRLTVLRAVAAAGLACAIVGAAIAQPAEISKSTADPAAAPAAKPAVVQTPAPEMQTHPSPTATVNAERAARGGAMPSPAVGDAPAARAGGNPAGGAADPTLAAQPVPPPSRTTP